ncbi:hypothetical protein HMPREF1569_4999 [Klebsiella oxytoca OK-1]|nr:hypothetical protein HMPREF1569_4999 [Klebsiella oxytoca OK-1]
MFSILGLFYRKPDGIFSAFYCGLAVIFSPPVAPGNIFLRRFISH